MEDDHCRNTEKVVDDEELVEVGESPRIDVHREDGQEGSEEIDHAEGPPELQNVSESYIDLDQVRGLGAVIRGRAS